MYPKTYKAKTARRPHRASAGARELARGGTVSGPNSNDPDRFARAIDVLHRAGDFAHDALIEAVRYGKIDMVFAGDRTAVLPWGRIRKSRKPTLILVADDDDLATGPDGWRFARKIASWARGAVVHGAGAKREHYQLAIGGAIDCRQFVVIDTASKNVSAWMELFKHCFAVAIMPADGTHPVADQAETMH